MEKHDTGEQIQGDDSCNSRSGCSGGLLAFLSKLTLLWHFNIVVYREIPNVGETNCVFSVWH